MKIDFFTSYRSYATYNTLYTFMLQFERPYTYYQPTIYYIRISLYQSAEPQHTQIILRNKLTNTMIILDYCPIKPAVVHHRQTTYLIRCDTRRLIRRWAKNAVFDQDMQDYSVIRSASYSKLNI
jgi:hypothetical protein